MPKRRKNMEKRKILGNAFSLQMLDTSVSSTIVVTPVTATEVASSNFVSVIGHPDTARVVSGLLGKEVAFNRANLHLGVGDVLYVAQVIGGRLPEGATTLPEGVSLQFLKVTLL